MTDLDAGPTVFRRGHCVAEGRVAVAFVCVHCGREIMLVGGILSELTEQFIAFCEQHKHELL